MTSTKPQNDPAWALCARSEVGCPLASRVTGRGAGAMIGGLVAMTLDPSVLRQLGLGRRTAVVTGTNGKSTTTRMVAAALRTMGSGGGAGPPTSDRTSEQESGPPISDGGDQR